MFKTVTTALSTLALSSTAALAMTGDTTLDFPMDQQSFLDAVPNASVAEFETIDTQRDGTITQDEFESAIAAGIIDDPRTGDAAAAGGMPMLEFPLSEQAFLDAVPGASLAEFQTIDTARDGFITEDQFEQAVEAGVIEDPRTHADGTAGMGAGPVLTFPMTEQVFLELVPDASRADFQTIDAEREGMITEDQFEQAVEAGVIEDPRG